MPKPLIGLTTYLTDAQWGEWDLPAALLPAAYISCLQVAGGHAVLLPPDAPEAAADVVARLDAIVLTGGEDVEPALYGAQPHPCTGPPVRERDRWERAVLAAGLERDIPVLGVCRGMQLMNVHAGGTLIQHLPDEVGHHGHNPHGGHFAPHAVTTVPGTRIGALLPGTRQVATHHHQAVASLGAGLVVGARAAESTIEAIECNRHRFVVGVQWHPEMAFDSAVVYALVAAAGSTANADRTVERKARARRSSPDVTVSTPVS
ncbi:gamma-glutamyl-gamma-aminobutyrate hydrolase family protein [Kitasatospora sp. DSM 101779]|uniref:gamma-glutamyl-gamma-aminobutyrate hydrolase family protein n=1 Tax=Kitasatospora sp. DSM 101779 TaxID=2853165 RepID=UPI0021DB2E89|nr:gamma-glutamyl-gamma-aminobutyrate hydrolase family protein [Kitasatospora sp. DSM 101779]MCU7826466.1 gamma-glutamyl-gamma-aminobutyrate hydrolase family protein [Kitasatospora sp. DSM 101779]